MPTSRSTPEISKLPGSAETDIFRVELTSDGNDYVIISPSRPAKLSYRLSKRDVNVVDSVASSAGDNRFHIRINPNAGCLKMETVSLADVVKDFEAAGSIEDEPVSVTSTRVDKAKELLTASAVYAKGCSEFVCAVLGTAWEDANSLMGSAPQYIGDNNNYPGLVPGDIVGWKVSGGNGHVAVFIGEAGTKFIDVKEPGMTPRRVVNGYGNGQSVFKSSKF